MNHNKEQIERLKARHGSKWKHYMDLHEQFKRDNPHLCLEGSEFHQAIKEQSQVKVTRKFPEPVVDIEKMTEGKPKRKRKEDLTEEDLQEMERIKRNYQRLSQKIENSYKLSASANAMKPRPRKLMPLHQAKLIVWDIMQVLLLDDETLKFTQTAKVRCGTKQVHKLDYKQLLHYLTIYFTRNDGGLFDENRGLMFFGFSGCGKSYLMKVFSTFTAIADKKDEYLASSPIVKQHMIESAYKIIHKHRPDFDTGFRYVPVDSIVEDINKYKNIDRLYRYTDGNVAYDDIGFDPKREDVNAWGNKANIFQVIIQKQERAVAKKLKNIHVTTNLLPQPMANVQGTQPDTILGIYGERILSRCKKMFNFIMMDGLHFRDPKNQ